MLWKKEEGEGEGETERECGGGEGKDTCGCCGAAYCSSGGVEDG